MKSTFVQNDFQIIDMIISFLRTMQVLAVERSNILLMSIVKFRIHLTRDQEVRKNFPFLFQISFILFYTCIGIKFIFTCVLLNRRT